MKPDERRLAIATLAAQDASPWPSAQKYASVWLVSESFEHPIHERRLRWLVEKWIRKGYWSPLMSLSGNFTPAGRDWVMSLSEKGEHVSA